jgi:hypothetical protein
MRSNDGNIKKKIWKVNLFIDNFKAMIKAILARRATTEGAD